jgi:hypothetical protein
MSEEPHRDQLLRQLDRSALLRVRALEDAGVRKRRRALRAWQASRLARTHRDLLDNPRFHDAAQFFLTDLYGPKDLSRHIEDVRRVVPVMTRLLPDSGLATVAHAVELNALSESLDAAMADALGTGTATIRKAAYAAAYRKVGRAGDRERQVDLIELLGGALEGLARQRFVGAALKMMRGPARAAGLGELQGFLERGYSAFRAMRGGSDEFISSIVVRERLIAKALLAGDDGAL